MAEFVMDSYNIILIKEKVPTIWEHFSHKQETMKLGFDQLCSAIGDKGMVQTRACVFRDAVDLERVKAWDQVFIKLMRRYNYLEKMLSEVYLRGFTQVKM